MDNGTKPSKREGIKEQRTALAEKLANGEIKPEKGGKEMVIVASSMPKAFQLSGDGKAYDDAFKPQQYSPAKQQEQPKQQAQQPEKADSREQKREQPKISFDR